MTEYISLYDSYMQDADDEYLARLERGTTMTSASLDAIRRNLRLIIALAEASLSENKKSPALTGPQCGVLHCVRLDAQLLLSVLQLENKTALCDEVGEPSLVEEQNEFLDV